MKKNSFKKFLNSHYNKKNKAFTLVEFMVVIGIFIVMVGLTLVRYSNISSSVSIENLAQDMAISIRKAQLYSVGVKETNSALGKIFPPGYGVSFSPPSSGGNSKTYTIFADVDFPSQISGNKMYDDMSMGGVCGANSLNLNHECLEKITITSEDFIKEIYVDNSVCSSNLDIVFTRPNLVATIHCGMSLGQEAKIEISNQDGKIKNIIIPTAGNIYVN